MRVVGRAGVVGAGGRGVGVRVVGRAGVVGSGHGAGCCAGGVGSRNAGGGVVVAGGPPKARWGCRRGGRRQGRPTGPLSPVQAHGRSPERLHGRSRDHPNVFGAAACARRPQAAQATRLSPSTHGQSLPPPSLLPPRVTPPPPSVPTNPSFRSCPSFLVLARGRGSGCRREPDRGDPPDGLRRPRVWGRTRCGLLAALRGEPESPVC